MPVAAETAEYAGDQKCPPLLEKWQERIKPALETQRERVKDFERNREYARGEQHRDSSGKLVRTNLIYANQSTIVPHIYAKNPEISVSPSKAVTPARYQQVKKFAQTMEVVLQRMFVLDTQLKKRMRGALYSVMDTGDGWLKMIYQRDYPSDPLLKQRIHDSQDNLARMERLINETKEVDSSKNLEAQRDELKVMIEAMQKQVEVVVSEGLVIDRILTDDILVLDRTLIDFDAYVQADALDHMVWMTKDEYVEITGRPLPENNGPNIYHERKHHDDKANRGSSSGVKKPGSVELVCVHEVWHLRTNTVYTFADGAKEWAREPYQPERMGERWYPFFRLGWNLQDGTHEAIPDVTLQRDLQDEYNASRTQWKAAREGSKPMRIIRGNGSLTEQDVKNIQNAKADEYVVVDGRADTPLSNDIAQMDSYAVDMTIYDTNPIRGDMELVAGRGDAAAGGVVEAKTATEAEIQQAGLMSRSDYRRDVTEDLITEMATCAAQMLLQEMTVPQIQFIAGQDAVWPQMAKMEVFALINIEVRAGSTGKPNQAKEREQWTQLHPMLAQTIQQIFELRMMGNFQLAEVLSKLMKETLRRFDERLDLEEFIGPEGEQGQAAQQQMMAMQQKIMELQAALEQATAQLQQVDQQKMQAEQEAAEDKRHERSLREREFDERREERQMAREEQAVKSQNDERKRADEGKAKADMEREKWDREDRRAREGRDHEKQMKGQDELVQQLQEKLAAYEQARGTPETDDDGEARDGLREVMARLAQALETDADEKRATREMVAGYLKNKQPSQRPRAE